MKQRLNTQWQDVFANLKLNRKIQLSLLAIIVPLFVLFVILFFSVYRTNQQYDRIIINATQAGQFSIKFKEEFDYKIYLLIAGHSTFQEENPYIKIDEAKLIVDGLIRNTNIPENKVRAESIKKLLGNLEKYVGNIEENKKVGGHYDDNITIWENDVQLVTALIQSNVLEYTYYETNGMEKIRQEMSANFKKMTIIGLSVFMLLLVVALLLSLIIPNSIVKPIHHLNLVTKQVAKGDLSTRAHILKGAEVKELGDSLNIMIEKIDQLLLEVKEDEKNLRDAELELLQAQINPHFLYNTLDTIIWLAESCKQDEVVKVVSSLSDFFRTSLNHGNGMFTLSEEERHMRSYLQIQQVRYQDILAYEIDIPERFKTAVIPKITIQPLIENALYHGIKNRRGMGKITVTATSLGNDILLCIADNGIGMSPERLQQVIEGLTTVKRDFYGLYNVNERIKLRFGNKYGLTITSTLGEGTCVQVKIPMEDLRNEMVETQQ